MYEMKESAITKFADETVEAQTGLLVLGSVPTMCVVAGVLAGLDVAVEAVVAAVEAAEAVAALEAVLDAAAVTATADA